MPAGPHGMAGATKADLVSYPIPTLYLPYRSDIATAPRRAQAGRRRQPLSGHVVQSPTGGWQVCGSAGWAWECRSDRHDLVSYPIEPTLQTHLVSYPIVPVGNPSCDDLPYSPSGYPILTLQDLPCKLYRRA